jgi:glutaconyl-CoA/methylmalonyl-CoA decarboxylase subunit gamma
MARRYSVTLAGADRSVELERLAGGRIRARVDGCELVLRLSADGGLALSDAGRVFRVEALVSGKEMRICVDGAEASARVEDEDRARLLLGRAPTRADGARDVRAPMPGRIVRIAVRAGDAVAAGQALIVVEAMKMENELRAAGPGTVREVAVKEGQAVDAGQRLVVIDGDA